MFSTATSWKNWNRRRLPFTSSWLQEPNKDTTGIIPPPIPKCPLGPPRSWVPPGPWPSLPQVIFYVAGIFWLLLHSLRGCVLFISVPSKELVTLAILRWMSKLRRASVSYKQMHLSSVSDRNRQRAKAKWQALTFAMLTTWDLFRSTGVNQGHNAEFRVFERSLCITQLTTPVCEVTAQPQQAGRRAFYDTEGGWWWPALNDLFQNM